MDELDDLLRDTFRSRQETALDLVGLTGAVREGHARRTTRNRRLAAVGTVAVLAVGGSTALAVSRQGGTDGGQPGTAVTADGSRTAGTTGLHGATRAWSSHGLQVLVPAAWQPNVTHCGLPIADTVLIGDRFEEACALGSTPPVSVVEFGTAVPDPRTMPPTPSTPLPALRTTEIAGHSAKAGTGGLADGRTVAYLSVPDLNVSILVKSKDAGLVAGIVGSARIVDADANGCPSKLGKVEPAGPPTRDGATARMVPGRPVKAVICHYSGPGGTDPAPPASDGSTYLAVGAEVDPGRIGELTTLLNALRPGLGSWTGLPGGCKSAEHDGYLIRFSYDSGPALDVYLHTETCDHIGFDNGAVVGYLSPTFIDKVRDFWPAFGIVFDAGSAKGR